MRILVVKTTSLGDLVHMLPALTEAATALPGLRADWVAEEGFAAVPALHPAVDRVIPVALRRWRKSPLSGAVRRQWGEFITSLRSENYDLVLDSQGLLKSALLAVLAHGPRAGLDFASAREPLASLVYRYRYSVRPELHAITRNRLLTAQALGYAMAAEAAFSYGVVPLAAGALALPDRFVLALHGTARPEKEYPEAAWRELIGRVTATGMPVLLPWGNEREQARAERLAAASPGARVLPRLNLAAMTAVLGRASVVAGVDTGLMHLAAAFRKPGIGLYPATPPARFGAWSEPGAPVIENLADADDLAPLKLAEKLEKLLVQRV
ncbi:MAG: lipopolysaccharide heptosyltransferase I [Hydrogenophilales bacterium CG03_land_8_20_14_0_80_62_28]|nr:lipopolysaccharide heptosyltransferase I [Betaproteobacteria bacterium]OIO76716.1 MAG: lipopolysaccharide heptosyltransferase I [Hydrogenophilaceae bacterium CG1_02_62_390]PIV23451.1 MAG: lipopolysaccharide heptosyltransferase I [Hydrogenophilales bacterium CG03_land_8_20_14_0_80_62_28]PIW38705.1 MAG: lipopolysaccharide heptosyltransferase I [Hydrogenophilales bacterium CG15_BIG_FIL_POST_REV_8_21_14_020_62_31]PIW71592.1 MAG: lipopolysaccharide heptosyltransferase I [Hydrogenophilales bacteri